MSDRRERRPASRAGLERILAQALDVLREDGLSEDGIASLLAFPASPRANPMPSPVHDEQSFERLVESAGGGDVHAQHMAALEMRAWLRQKMPLPEKVQEYLLSVIENRDEVGIGWRGTPHRDPVVERNLQWARAMLVFFVADGDRAREAEALATVARLDGKSSPKKLRESCGEAMRANPEWGKDRRYLALSAVLACRILLDRLP